MPTMQTATYVPTAAAAIHAAVPMVRQRGDDPIVFSRASLLQLTLACLMSGEQCAMAGKLAPPRIPVPGTGSPFVLGIADEAILEESRKGTIAKLVEPERATQTDVPARDAAILFYLANRRAARLCLKDSRPSSAPVVIGVPGADGPTLPGPEGSPPQFEIPGLGPVPMPSGLPGIPSIPFPGSGGGPVVVPGPLFAHSSGSHISPVGAAIVVALGAAGIAAGAYTVSETAKAAIATEARKAEIAAQAKLAADIAAAKIAAGQSVDVPSVVAAAAKSESDEWALRPYVIGGAVAGVLLVGGYLYFRRKAA